MAYFPKSRIITGKFSNKGDQLFDKDGIKYEGEYYITYEGKRFSGVDSQQRGSKPLFKQNNNFNENLNNSIFKKNTKNIAIQELIEPEIYYPIINELDYKRGNILRYFAKKRNESIIIEIDKDTYEDIFFIRGKYNYPMWKVIYLNWRISGILNNKIMNNGMFVEGVIETNKRIIESKRKVFFGIEQYLLDYKQLYK